MKTATSVKKPETNAAPAQKTRVAILGAGPAGLAAAFALSDSDELRARYDVHIYQAGWRAGGKCRTGRAADRYLRVEQNGSHYLFGCYHHSFGLVRKAFAELEARHGKEDARRSFGSFEDEFVARSLLVAKEPPSPPSDGWANWFRSFPTTLGDPGRGGKYARPFDYLWMMAWFGILAFISLFATAGDKAPCPVDKWMLSWTCLCRLNKGRWAKAWRGFCGAWAWLVNVPIAKTVNGLFNFGGWLWQRISSPRLNLWLERVAMTETLAFLTRVRDRLRDPEGPLAHWATDLVLANRDVQVARGRMLIDLMCTLMIGVVKDRLWSPGRLAAIDHLDLREWLSGHGLARETQERCAFLRVWYDAVAAYENAQPQTPRISAAVSINALFRASMTFKGAFAFQMRNEIGDAFIAPIYQTLVDRGVRFHFFRRVRDVVPGKDESGAPVIDRIVLEAQRDDDDYDPLDVHQPTGRKYWPAQPRVGVDAAGESLESFWARDSGKRVSLQRRGTAGAATAADADVFDEVVFALPVGVIPHCAQRLLQENEDWQRMVAQVKITETHSLRMWFGPDLAKLGWNAPPPILSAYAWPFSTWEDNEAKADIAQFPDGHAPEAIATVFGPLWLPPVEGEDVHAPAYLIRRQAQARRAANRFLREQIHGLWNVRGADGQTDGALFVAPGLEKGAARLRWQHVSVNAGPVESYTMATPGSMSARLRADESGYANLFLAGEWTRNGVEVGSLEGAVMSGLQAARAISGAPSEILGARDLDFGLL